MPASALITAFTLSESGVLGVLLGVSLGVFGVSLGVLFPGLLSSGLLSPGLLSSGLTSEPVTTLPSTTSFISENVTSACLATNKPTYT